MPFMSYDVGGGTLRPACVLPVPSRESQALRAAEHADLTDVIDELIEQGHA